MDTYAVIANQYDTEQDAIDDYNAVRKLYTETGLIDTYDAAVLKHDAKGKVEIVKRVEEPTRHGGAMGLLIGLAAGVSIALFPAVGIGLAAGLLGGGAIGAGVGAVAGHVVGGMRRSDLKDLGELLDKGKCGLIVVAASNMEAKVEAAITRTKKRLKAQLQADTNELKREIDAIRT